MSRKRENTLIFWRVSPEYRATLTLSHPTSLLTSFRMSQRSDMAQWEKMKCDSRDHSTHQPKTRFPPTSPPIYCGIVSKRHLQDKQHANSPTLGSLRDVHSRRLLSVHGSVLDSRHHNKKNAKGVVLFYGTGRDPLLPSIASCSIHFKCPSSMCSVCFESDSNPTRPDSRKQADLE